MEIESRELGQIDAAPGRPDGPQGPGERGCPGMVLELRDPGGMCHSRDETCGAAGSGAHVKASGTSLPANQSCASLFLTRHFALVLISILAG